MNYIGKVTLPDTSTYKVKDYATLYYAVCNTAAATVIKQVDINEFEQEVGTTIKVLFSNGNSASNPELEINDGNAEPIYLNDGNINLWNAGEVISLTWDGTYWRANDYGKIEVIRL